MKLTEEEKRKKYFENRYKNTLKLKEREKQKYLQKKENGELNKSISIKRQQVFDKDKQVYKQVWDSHPSHKCEECGAYLGDLFEDEEGKVINTYRYSHILTKSSHPKLRHCAKNFKLYCLKCHSKWEFSTEEERKKMKTYDSELIQELLKIEASI